MSVLKDAVLGVEGSCVTAVADGRTHLLVWGDGYEELAHVRGDAVVFNQVEWRSGDRVESLRSGQAYHLTGVVDSPFVEPITAGWVCEYDSTLLMTGVVPASDSVVFDGFATYETTYDLNDLRHPKRVWTVTIDGSCVTVEGGDYGTAIVFFPVSSVAMLPSGQLHYSQWPFFADETIASGDNLQVMLERDLSMEERERLRLVDEPPPDCDYDERAYVQGSAVTESSQQAVFDGLPETFEFDGIEATAFRGPEHCDWHSTWIIHVRSEDLLGPFTPNSIDHWFIRDPAVMPQVTYSAGPEPDRELPSDAERIGTSADGYELWYAHSDSSYIYLTSDGQTEAWVRAAVMVFCM